MQTQPVCLIGASLERYRQYWLLSMLYFQQPGYIFSHSYFILSLRSYWLKFKVTSGSDLSGVCFFSIAS